MKSPNIIDPGNNLPVSTNNYRENLNVKIYISLVYDLRPCQAQMDDFPQMPGPNRVSGAGADATYMDALDNMILFCQMCRLGSD